MPAFPREELEEMVRRWLQANEKAEAEGDWVKHLGPFYTEDAEYSWNNGPKYDFIARGRDQICEWALGTEMEGLEGWTYPYDRILIDEKQGEIVGFWRQVAPVKRDDGSHYEIAGVGGSWFRYAGDYQWSWQKDFFDHANNGAIFLELAKNGQLSEGMEERMRKGAKMPGWTRRGE
jgi:hypothetical protein